MVLLLHHLNILLQLLEAVLKKFHGAVVLAVGGGNHSYNTQEEDGGETGKNVWERDGKGRFHFENM